MLWFDLHRCLGGVLGLFYTGPLGLAEWVYHIDVACLGVQHIYCFHRVYVDFLLMLSVFVE